MLTTARHIQRAAMVCALACALYASAIGTATACERGCLRRIASMGYERIAAAYNPPWRGERSSATVVRGLGPQERRYVQGIMRLTPEQIRAGFGTVGP